MIPLMECAYNLPCEFIAPRVTWTGKVFDVFATLALSMTTTLNVTNAVLPLLKGNRMADGTINATGYLGSATVIGNEICTCKHVIESIDYVNEVVLTKWIPHEPNSPWVVFTGADIHPRYDFAVLKSTRSHPLESLPLADIQDMGLQVYVFGFHDDGVNMQIDGQKLYKVAPRAFFGNVVRFFNESNNMSSSVCELSFPTLSGFSGAPVISSGLDSIVGMVYGNVEQKIQVHSKYELREGKMEFSETVNRILELGLFHSVNCIKRCLVDLGRP